MVTQQQLSAIGRLLREKESMGLVGKAHHRNFIPLQVATQLFVVRGVWIRTWETLIEPELLRISTELRIRKYQDDDDNPKRYSGVKVYAEIATRR